MHMQNLLGTIKDDLQKVWNKSNTAVVSKMPFVTLIFVLLYGFFFKYKKYSN